MKYCGFDGCQVKIERGTYCKEHAPRRKPKSKKSAYHHENKPFYRTQAWRDVSDYVYEREAQEFQQKDINRMRQSKSKK